MRTTVKGAIEGIVIETAVSRCSRIVGRLFREFAVTLSLAIAVSMLVSLTLTPMMCATLLRGRSQEPHGRFYQDGERLFQWLLEKYRASLAWVLRHQPLTLLVTLLTMAATTALYVIVPKGFFPQQDTGRISGSIVADQDTSFQSMRGRMTALAHTVASDPAVDAVMAFNGGGFGRALNTGNMFITLKPLERTRHQRRSDHRPAARQAGAVSRRESLSAAGAGPARRRPRRPTPNISTRSRAITF